MTAQIHEQDDDSLLREGLTTLWRLTPEDTARIEEMMVARGLSFAKAAVACGVVTQHELAQAFEWVERPSRDEYQSIVETAIRRRATTQIVPRQHAEQVKPGPKLLPALDPFNPRSERLRDLRTELLLLQKHRIGPSAMALVSPGAGEGRSLLAADLAISFAQIGRRTLLVDADLRRPSMHTLFGAENQWGLAQALSFTQSPRLIGVEGLPQLSLVTAGAAIANPLELLSDGRFERLLSGWKRSFEFVILDTPPLSEYSDALAIASMAGGALILMRAAFTSLREMQEMMRRLAGTESHILGAVMNNF